ncbi:MAG: hypothetical protein ACR2JU_06705 [Nocardioidaceae bacterium]
MSVRHRSIAGAPHRPAGETAAKVTEMITETLAPASTIDDAQVASELNVALPSIRSLVAAKQLGDDPIVLVADALRLEIRVVCGAKAIGIDEYLGKVVGAAQASDWSLHVPAGATLGSWVSDAVEDLEHVTTDPAFIDTQPAKASSDAPVLDVEALRLAGGGGS